mgnify:CR=1 FL=1
MGIVKADSGQIFGSIDGKKISRLDTLAIHERCKEYKIGFIPQNESVFSGLTAAENLRAIAEIVIKNQEQRQTVIENLLSEFTLNDVRNVLAKNLSGGSRKKLVIARALINKPKLLICDEIFSAIDPKTIETIKEIIIKLQRKGISILISDHAFENVLQIADKVYIISEGQIVSSGKPQDIVKDHQARKTYFGDTY